MRRDRSPWVMLSASVRDRFDPTVSNRPNRSSRRIAVPEHAFPCRFVCADVTARCMSVSELLPSFSLGPSNPPSSLSACVQSFGRSAGSDCLGADIASGLGWTGEVWSAISASEGTTFREISRQVQLQASQRLLKQGASVSDVAKALGFSEISAFTHAFRRWSGETPSSWKLRHAPPKAERPRKAQGPWRTTRPGAARRRP